MTMRAIRRAGSSGALLVLACAIAACGGSTSWQPPAAVKITSDVEVGSLFPSWGTWLTDGPDANTQGLLLRDGDYILGRETPFRYQPTDGKSITLTSASWNGQLGSVIVSLDLDHDEARQWISKATPQQLAAVRSLSVPRNVDTAALLALKQLASANANVDLMFGSEEAMRGVVPLFHPRAVFASRLSNPDVLKALSGQSQLDTILFEASEPGSLSFLADLPKLTRLLLSKWDGAKTGPLPPGLSNLKAVSVTEGDLKDLAPLGAVASTLEELAIVGGLATLNGLDKLTHLRTLVLTGNEKVTDLSALSAANELRWLGLPASTTQAQFAKVVSEHPDLQILELTGADQIADLAPLAGLKHLEGLILGGPYSRLESLKGLTSLRYLGIPRKTWEAAPGQIEELKKVLPDTLVVRVKPLCLGSGWILLLVPVLALGWIRRR